MRVVTIVLGAQLLVAAGADAGEVGPTPAAVMRLVWSDRNGGAVAVRAAVLHELTGHLRAAGVDLRVTVWDGSDRQADPDEIHVVIDDLPPLPMTADSLGTVQMAPGRLRSVYVFVGAIKRVLGLTTHGSAPLPPSASRDLARAVARVVLHELVHEGAGAAHRPCGLMAARVDRHLLVDPLLALDSDLMAALRAASSQSDGPAELPQAASR
jgi:hypothetical protein